MPYILISVLCVVVLGSIGYLSPIMKLICFINTVGSSVYFFDILLILVQIPNRSKIIMNGQRSYYKVN